MFKLAIVCAGVAVPLSAAAQVKMDCMNHASDEPFTEHYAFDGDSTVAVDMRGEKSRQSYVFVDPYVAVSNGEVFNLESGTTAWVSGGMMNASAAEIEQQAEFEDWKTCTIVSGSFGQTNEQFGETADITDEPDEPAGPAGSMTWIAPGEAFTLTRGEKVSHNGFYMSLQDDGNFVVKKNDGTFVHGFNEFLPANKFTRIHQVKFQEDGNFAAYDADGGYIWSAMHVVNTDGSLVFSEDGDIWLVNQSGGTEWAFSWKEG
jgi:hypothetical protein